MPRVFIPGPLRALTGGQSEVDLEGVTVGQLIGALDAQFPGIRQRLCAGNELSPALQVSVDGVFSRRGLDAPVRPTGEVHFLPIFGGG